MMRRARRHPRGYVLLLTLLLLAIAAAALAGVCRAGLTKAVQASRAQDDLQRRWGTLSCRTALLPKAPAVFAETQGAPAAETIVQLDLGGQSMTLTFGDEQAKANVNLLFATGGQAGATAGAREIARVAGTAMRVELRPVMPEDTDDSAPTSADSAERDESDGLYADLDVQPLLRSWTQVCPRTSPGELLRRRGTLPSVTSNLTCWGDGMLNARRASREALMRACDRVLTPAQVSKLITAREKDPAGFDVWETLDAMELKEGPAADLEKLLTDESTTFSLWIVSRSGGREWYHLAVADFASGGGGGEIVGETLAYEW